MPDYLSHTVLGLALTDTDPTKTLYFQDSALFPAFLLITQTERSSLPNEVALTPIYPVLKKAFKLVLPGATFPSFPFLPLDVQLSSILMSPWVYGFSDLGIIVLNGVSYTLFDDVASDLFIIAPSFTTLASLNAKFTGSHRVTPTLVIKTLKRISELLGNVTLSNTQVIPDPNPTVVIPPPVVIVPPPAPPAITFPSTDTANTMTVDGILWNLGRDAFNNSNILNISRPVASNLDINTVNTLTQKNRLELALNTKIPTPIKVLSNPRLSSFMTTDLLWTVT